MKTHHLPRIGAILALVSLMFGCGMNMEKNYKKMRPNLLNRDFEAADKQIDAVKESFYSKDNRLLYYMDKGMVLHLAKRYEDSNKFMEQAKTAAEELWTESISANAAALMTTDNALPYPGEDFEKVAIHFVGAFNYIGLGNYEAARVEARQIGNELQRYTQKYAEEKAESVYKDDAFARWLSGKLAETEKGNEAINDAWIDYKKAIAVYGQDYAARYSTPVPKFVIEDALRAVTRLGSSFQEEREELQKRFTDVKAPVVDKAMGEVVLLHMAGEAPYKIDKFWEHHTDTDILRIAYPEFVAKPFRITGARMSAGGQEAASQVAEPVTAIAIQNLNDHQTRIKAKAIIRAVAKFAVAKGTQAAGAKTGGNAGAAMQLGGAVFEVFNAAAEEADKRSWITMPAAINVSRMFLPAGDTKLNVDFIADDGTVLENTTFDVKVEAGKPVFVTYRTFQ